MSAEPLPPPTNPVAQFRLRTLLATTTAIAVLAAIAGPYYRQQSPEAQSKLLMFWASVLVFGAFGLWYHWRLAWRMPTSIGEIRFVLSTARGRYSPLRRIPGQALLLLLWFAIMATYSSSIVQQTNRGAPWDWTAAVRGFAVGLATGGGLIALVRQPAYLGDKGVLFEHGYGRPWQYIRHAEWLDDRPGVLKFRRLDGDIYVDVPLKMRARVEAFVREKTSFVDAATFTNLPDPSAPGH